MIEIEVRCQRCRVTFIPLHADYIRGVWRVCPRCRDGPERCDPPKDDRHDEPDEGHTERTPHHD